MINDLLFLLTLLSALGCGLMAGFFFAFSAVVMNALARLPLAQGIAAMQSINVAVARSYKVINPWFGAAFFGTAVACVLLAFINTHAGRRRWRALQHFAWKSSMSFRKDQRPKSLSHQVHCFERVGSHPHEPAEEPGDARANLPRIEAPPSVASAVRVSCMASGRRLGSFQ